MKAGRERLQTVVSWLPAIMFMIVLSCVSHVPGQHLNMTLFPMSDKLLHFSAYSILGVLLQARTIIRGRLTRRVGLPSLLWPGMSAGIAHGIMDEIHQKFIPFREFSYLDMTANLLGVTAGIVLFSLFLSRKPRDGLPS
ncbi:VanZ family protein [Fibrobacterota bacterium]